MHRTIRLNERMISEVRNFFSLFSVPTSYRNWEVVLCRKSMDCKCSGMRLPRCRYSCWSHYSQLLWFCPLQEGKKREILEKMIPGSRNLTLLILAEGFLQFICLAGARPTPVQVPVTAKSKPRISHNIDNTFQFISPQCSSCLNIWITLC